MSGPVPRLRCEPRASSMHTEAFEWRTGIQDRVPTRAQARDGSRWYVCSRFISLSAILHSQSRFCHLLDLSASPALSVGDAHKDSTVDYYGRRKLPGTKWRYEQNMPFSDCSQRKLLAKQNMKTSAHSSGAMLPQPHHQIIPVCISSAGTWMHNSLLPPMLQEGPSPTEAEVKSHDKSLFTPRLSMEAFNEEWHVVLDSLAW